MKKTILHATIFFLLFNLTVFAQKRILPRGVLQQKYIISAFIEPQLKKQPLTIVRNTQIDSIFKVWENGWRKVSADSMANNPSLLTNDEFNNLDAYCYFWGLASITQNLNISNDYGSILVTKYMIPSLRRDLALIKRAAIPNIIENLYLVSTFIIGSEVNIDQETFMDTYALYKDYYAYYQDLAKQSDTLVSQAAKKQLPQLEKMYYFMNARYNYYLGEPDRSFIYLITGLSVDKYSKSRAISLTKKLTSHYVANGDKDKAFALLNTLAINTTHDILDRDTLLAWYLSIDAINGPAIYASLKSKLSSNLLKNIGKQVKLPINWTFVANSIPSDKIKKAKYILMDFWYAGCGPCLAEIPELNSFYSKIKNRDDVIFISINTDLENGKSNKAYVLRICKKLGIQYPVFYDTPVSFLSKQLEIPSYPTKIILKSNGEQLVKPDASTISIKSFEAFLKEIEKY